MLLGPGNIPTFLHPYQSAAIVPSFALLGAELAVSRYIRSTATCLLSIPATTERITSRSRGVSVLNRFVLSRIP